MSFVVLEKQEGNVKNKNQNQDYKKEFYEGLEILSTLELSQVVEQFLKMYSSIYKFYDNCKDEFSKKRQTLTMLSDFERELMKYKHFPEISIEISNIHEMMISYKDFISLHGWFGCPNLFYKFALLFFVILNILFYIL